MIFLDFGAKNTYFFRLHSGQPTPTSSASTGNNPAGFPHQQTQSAADSILAGLGPHHPALSPNFLASPAGVSHQEYLSAAAQRLSEMQASAALDPINAIEGTNHMRC